MSGAESSTVDVAPVLHDLRRWCGAVVACAVSLAALTSCTGSATSAGPKATSTSGSAQMVEHEGGDAKLSAAVDTAMSDKDGRHGNVRAVLVIHNGRTLVENYYHSVPTDHHNIYSITKSVLSTLAGIAISEGHLRLKQTLGQLLPAYRSSMSRSETGITVRQLLTMSAGFPDDSTSAFMAPRTGSTSPSATASTIPPAPRSPTPTKVPTCWRRSQR
jgi:CubicO group peptidase (beta-lactamase class C family)